MNVFFNKYSLRVAYDKDNNKIFNQCCAIALIIYGVRFLMIYFVIFSKLNFGFQPQSFLATSSSK
jgi:hypothetical protein